MLETEIIVSESDSYELILAGNSIRNEIQEDLLDIDRDLNNNCNSLLERNDNKITQLYSYENHNSLNLLDN